MKKLAIVRGKFLNAFDMQSYEPLVQKYSLTAYGSLFPFHDTFFFPTVKLPSPMDIPSFPYKMQILNRVFIDAHHLFGLEKKLKGTDIVDTAETYFYFSKQVIAAKQRGLIRKVVVRVYENIPFNNEGIWGRKQIKAYIRSYTNHFIAISQKSKLALHIEGVPLNKITVIGHGIDTTRFKPGPEYWRRVRNSRSDPLAILFVGRLEKEKGIFETMEAFRMVCQKKGNPKLFLTYVGKGNEEMNLKRKIREYGLQSVITCSSATYTDMPKVYATADMIVAPSKKIKTWEEQYNIALLEAQSMGLPIVTTKSGGIPENVGSCALFCEEANSQSLAEQMQQFIDNSHMRVYYARKARERALKTHDIRFIAAKLDRVYTSLDI